MSSLGIYFGSKFISIVETKGKKILNNIQISRSQYSVGELGERVPEELKIVAIFKEELRKNRIEAREASVTLSGKDLVIRNFEMPVLSRQELETAVNFEAKKYIPFKVEDLVSDFQLKSDRFNRQNLILFAGIKKEVLDKYLSIFSQLDIRPNVIEYSAFSVLRFLQLAELRYKGIICIINIDLQEEDEVNFLVLENGFPLFSRDITLLGGPEGAVVPQEIDTAAMLEKLKIEIHISLDYYNRKLPLKKISKAFFIADPVFQADLEVFGKDLGLAAQFKDVTKYLDKTVSYSPSLIKGYGCSLFKTIRTDVRINLLSAKAKVKPPKEKAVAEEAAPLFSGFKVSPLVILLGLALCGLVLAFFYIYKIQPLRREIAGIISQRPSVATVSPSAPYEELSSQETSYRGKINNIAALFKKEIYATEVLEALPRLMPEGVWLLDLSFWGEESNKELMLKGMAYLADNTRELGQVNDFVSALKGDRIFGRYFKNITLLAADTRAFQQKTATHFSISCRMSKGGK